VTTVAITGSATRRWAAALALFTAAMLIIQIGITLTGPGTSAPLAKLIKLFSFFTILTNTLVAVVAARAALGHGRPTLLAGTVIWIAVVGLVYNLLLRGQWHPQGLAWVADNGLHVVTPLGYLAWWWRLAPKTFLPWSQALAWLVYPLAYTAYALTRGTLLGEFPYWFMDYSKLGIPATMAWLGGMLAMFALLGVGTVALARRLAANEQLGHRLGDGGGVEAIGGVEVR
jgi:hypothetical protein